MNNIQFPEELCNRKLPVNFKSEDLPLFETDLHYLNKKKPVLFLKNCIFLKDILFDSRRFKFYDTYCYVLKKPYFKLLSRLIYFFHPRQTIDTAVWVIDNWSKEYFHWLTDVLSRILIAEKYIEDYPIVLPSYYRKFNYVTESLDILGIQYAFFENKHLLFKDLILTPQVAITGNFDVKIINKLRDRFVDSSKESSRFIYISRQKANRRKVTNEEEVIAVLLHYNFEIHFFEDYTLAHQIEIMQDTKILMSIHGAGLTNMLFMPKNGKIIELRNETETKLNCFFSLASDLEHEYYYLTNNGSSKVTHSADLTVDIDKFKRELQQIFNLCNP